MYTCVQVAYDALGRLTEWRRSVTTDVSDDDVVRYVYDVDSNVISVSGTDACARQHQDDVTDGDGLVVVRRGGQRLTWSSRSQLTRVSSEHVNSTYVYDAVGRLTAVLRPTTSLQLFYSDSEQPDRVTQIYDSASRTVVEYFYDELDGHLRAARINGTGVLYVAVDPHGSPIYVFNEAGQVVRRMSYTARGSLRLDVGSVRQTTPWYIGYRGAFHDAATGLLFFAGRVLDPLSGRWLSPNYQPFTARHRHSLTSFIRNYDLYETNFLCHSDVTPPPLMLSKSQYIAELSVFQI